MIALRSLIMQGPWRPFLIKASILTIVLAIGFDYIAGRYRLGLDWQVERCLPDTRAVLIDLWSPVPERGELIAFRGRGLEPLFADGTHMVKILAGLPGDHVIITREKTTINGIKIAEGLHLASRLGQEPKDFERSFTVPDGQYFGVGKAPISFDSRYFGLISEDQVLGKAWRLG